MGPPCATGFSGRVDGCGGIEDGLAEAPEVAGGVCAAGGCAGRMLESCSGCAVAVGWAAGFASAMLFMLVL